MGFRKRPKVEDAVVIAQAEAPNIAYVNWRKDPQMRKLYFYAAIICVASATNGYDSAMFNSLQIMPAWQASFNSPTGSSLGRLTAMYSIGSVVSMPIVPILSDRFGRKVAIIVGCVIMIAAAAVQASAHTQPLFEGARFFMGFGSSLAQLASPLLLTEICHPQHRSRVTAVYNCLYNVGAFLNAWVAFGTNNIVGSWSWRVPTLLQGLPSLIQLLFIWFCPESPRWLISKDRHEEALEMLGKYHGGGDVQNPTVQFEYAEIKETLRLEFLYQKSSRYIDFLKTPGNRYRLVLILSLGIFSQWSGTGLIAFYSAIIYKSVGINDSSTQLGLDGGLRLLKVIISVTTALFIDRIGRRTLFLAATSLMLLFFTALTIIGNRYSTSDHPSTALGIIFVIVFWLHGLSFALAWSGILVAYTVEILPYKLRAKGVTVMNLSLQVALTMNTYVNPLAISKGKPWQGDPWKLYAIYTAWIAFELAFVYFVYPETRGPTLEEIVKIFDGEDAEVGIAKDETGIEEVDHVESLDISTKKHKDSAQASHVHKSHK